MALALALLVIVSAASPAELDPDLPLALAQPGAPPIDRRTGDPLPRPVPTSPASPRRLGGIPVFPQTGTPVPGPVAVRDLLRPPYRIQPAAVAIVRRIPLPVDRVSDPSYGVVQGSRVARAYARARLALAQYHCLDRLWVAESGWRWNAVNRAGSGAYGIPQALPGSKMAKAGADWRTNPVTQVRWGLGYISGRYGNACAAWSFWRANGWY